VDGARSSLDHAAVTELARSVVYASVDSEPLKRFNEGIVYAKMETLLKFLAHRGRFVSREHRRQIKWCRDIPTLDGWIDRAFAGASVDEMLAYPGTFERRLDMRRLYDTEALRHYIKGFVKGFARSMAKVTGTPAAEAVAKYEAQAKAIALLMFLDVREYVVSDEQALQIEQCVDVATLDGWIGLLATAESVDELLAR
jgi:hypothetical protein